MVDDPELVVLPAFVDTHNHLMLAAQNILGVPVSQATDIPALVRLIAERAAQTPAGQWIRTAADWHELRLAERRLPTAPSLTRPRRIIRCCSSAAGTTGCLTTRLANLSAGSRTRIMTTPAAIAAARSVDAYLDSLEEQGIKPGAGEGLLRVWGLKFVLDGGVEAAAMTRPYADRPGYLGELMWDRDALATALAACAWQGWPVGTHAMGDQAFATLLDAIGDARARAGDAPAGMFVVEHGGLIGGHIARAAGLGVHVTVQQALLDGLAPAFLAAWGQERTAALFPWRGLVDGGAWISAGTDHPIGPLSPLRAVGGMTTRATPAGVLGPEHAISREEALRLYTVAGARFLGGETAGALVPGAPADLAAYRADPFTCPDEQLPHLSPAATVIAGRIAYQGG